MLQKSCEQLLAAGTVGKGKDVRKMRTKPNVPNNVWPACVIRGTETLLAATHCQPSFNVWIFCTLCLIFLKQEQDASTYRCDSFLSSIIVAALWFLGGSCIFYVRFVLLFLSFSIWCLVYSGSMIFCVCVVCVFVFAVMVVMRGWCFRLLPWLSWSVFSWFVILVAVFAILLCQALSQPRN